MSFHPENLEPQPEHRQSPMEQNPNVGPDGPKIRDQAPRSRGERDKESGFVPAPEPNVAE